MKSNHLLALFALSALLGGCSHDDGETAVEPKPGEACPDPLDLGLPDGSCIRPGNLPTDCAEGFEHDGAYACEPRLPIDPCPSGSMALPGEDTCRPLMDCGQGRWGDIPVDATTEYVDGSFVGNSDGTQAQPWTTIGDAVAAAAPGAIIAVSAGTYQEGVLLSGKPVRVWGVCPDQVTLVGTGQALAPCPATTLCIVSGADGSELHGLTITGPAHGLAASGAAQLLADRVHWLDTGEQAVHLEGALGATEIRIDDSLIEGATDIGIYAADSVVQLNGSTVRAIRPRSDQTSGRGLQIQTRCVATAEGAICDSALRSAAQLTHSVIEQTHDFAIYLLGSDLDVDGSVIRLTDAQLGDQLFGRAVQAQPACDQTTAGVLCHPESRAQVTLTRSLVEQSHDTAVMVGGSDAIIEASVVRATLPAATSQTMGWGVAAQDICETPMSGSCGLASPANVHLLRSLVDQNVGLGVFIAGSVGNIESSVVSNTTGQAADGDHGNGVSVQVPCELISSAIVCDPSRPASGSITSSLIDNNQQFGVMVDSAALSLDGSVVRATTARTRDGLFGDGVAVLSTNASGSATLTRTQVDDNARAGVASFGALIALGSTHIGCAAFQLAGDAYQGHEVTLDDLGGNLCGCPAADGACAFVGANLEPPPPLVGAD